MGIIAFIILGLLAGIIAKAVMPGRDPGGIIVTTLIGIAGALLGGFIAGAIAKALLPGDDPGGFIVTGIFGIVGALIGGFIAGVLFDADPLDEFFDISTWLTAIIGSIILLALYRLVVDRSGGRALRA